MLLHFSERFFYLHVFFFNIEERHAEF